MPANRAHVAELNRFHAAVKAQAATIDFPFHPDIPTTECRGDFTSSASASNQNDGNPGGFVSARAIASLCNPQRASACP